MLRMECLHEQGHTTNIVDMSSAGAIIHLQTHHTTVYT